MDRILNDYITSKECHASAAGFALLRAGDSPRVIQNYKGSLGFASTQPFSEDSFIWLASGTKIVVSVAVLLAIEKGLFSLDDNAAKYISELAEPELLLGYEKTSEDEGRPITKKAETKITIRHLLTHTSGLAYTYAEKRLKTWAKYNNRTYGEMYKTLGDCYTPLLFEPGTGWAYGPGIDWAGRIVEVTSQCSLEKFCKDNIWDQIGAHDTTFRPTLRSDLLSRRLGLAQVIRNGAIIRPEIYPLKPATDLGGIGLWTTPRDFNSFLWHLFLKQDGLLTPQSLNLILLPQVTSTELVTDQIRLSNRGMLTKAYPNQIPLNVGFGSTITLQDIPGRRPNGSVGAVGLPNVHWWYDPTNRICGALYMQLVPAGLSETTNLLVELENAVYRGIQTRKYGQVYKSRM